MAKLVLPRNPLQKPKPDIKQENVPDSAFPARSWVPLLPDPVFTGRDDVLKAISKALASHPEHCGPVIVFGEPGSGKSQLALAFCELQSSHYQGVYWIEASQSSAIEFQIAACGQAMQIIPWPEKVPEQVEATLKAWSLAPKQLIVLNHVEDPSILSLWMKRIPKAATIITTSSIEAHAGYPVIRVGALKSQECVDLLRKLAPRFEKTSAGELDRLASQLGDLALFVDLAGRYLNERSKISPSQFQGEIEKALSASGTAVGEAVKTDLPSIIPAQAAATLLSLRLLDGRGERERLARRILHAASLCAPSFPIPMQLLYNMAEDSADTTAAVDRGLSWLYSLGLLRQTIQGPVIHSITAKIINRVEPELSGVLSALVDSIIASKSAPSLQASFNIAELPHLQVIAAGAEETGLNQSGILYGHLGTDLRAAGQLNEARSYLERALAHEERLYGPEHVRIAATAKELGKVLSDLGDLYAAKRNYERAIAITEKLFSPVYPEVANLLNDLGQVLFDLRDLIEAKVCYERAISIFETAYGYGPKHPALAVAAGNLGRVLRDMDDLQGAKSNFERALAIDEWVFGPRHPKVATRANYLGRLCYSLGDLNGARSCFERVTSILEESGGAEDAGLATAYNNLGLVLQDLGNASRAQDSFMRALEIDEKILGPEHPNVARDLNNLGGAYAALENFSAARDCFIRAMQLDEKIFGLVHPNNAANANNLGRVLYNMGDFLGAKKAFERTLMIDEKINGPSHAKVGTDVNNLGIVLYEIGNLDEAKICFERALEIFNKEYPKDHPKTVKAKRYLDRILERLKQR